MNWKKEAWIAISGLGATIIHFVSLKGSSDSLKFNLLHFLAILSLMARIRTGSFQWVRGKEIDGLLRFTNTNFNIKDTETAVLVYFVPIKFSL